MQESKPPQPDNTKNTPSVPAEDHFSLIAFWHRIRKALQSAVDYRIYDYRLTKWRFLGGWRYFKYRLSKYASLIRRLIILLVALLIATVLVHFFGVASLDTSHLATYFITLGAMTGGIIAIVFTLSIFAQQNAADLYSSQHFEIYTHDWIEKLAYTTIVIITLLFFGFGILIGSNPQIAGDLFRVTGVYGSLFLIGAIFVIIDWQYKNVRSKVNPINALTFLEKQAIKFLDNVHRDAQRIAGIIRSQNKEVSEGMALASIYNNYLTPHLANLDRQIENLFEISMKLSERNEIKTTNRGLAAVHNILSRFLQVRKDSSLALMSRISLFAVESDSQNFLSQSFERFNNAGEIFIRTRRIENARFIIDVYKSLAAQSKGISFANKQYENPIFGQTNGYLSFYIDFAIREKDQEIVLQGTRALSDLAVVAIEKNLQHSLIGIQKDLLKLAIFGITNRTTFIVDECINSWLRVILAIFHYKFFVADHAIKDTLQNIKTTTVHMDTAIKSGYLNGDIVTKMSLSKPYGELILTIRAIINNFFKLTDKDDMSFYRRNFIILLDELCVSLRHLSEEIHDCDNPLIDSIGRLIYDVNSVIIDCLDKTEFKEGRVQEDLRKQLSWNIHLPYWFAHHTKKFRASNAFDTLTDSVAKTGIKLFQKKIGNDLIIECIDSLYSLVKQCLEKIEKDYSYYDPPRQMEKLICLGILSLKHNKQPILEKIKEQIKEFEALYQKKYLADLKLPLGVDPNKVIGIAREDQLFREIWGWRNEFASQKYNRRSLLDTAREMMYEEVHEADIDRFMFDVWGKFPAHSPIAKELEREAKNKGRANDSCA